MVNNGQGRSRVRPVSRELAEAEMEKAAITDAKTGYKGIGENRLGFFRQQGSHKIYVQGAMQAIVPYHSKDLKKGTLHQIIKGPGLSQRVSVDAS